MRILSAKDDTGTAKFAREKFLIDGVNLRGSKGSAGGEPKWASVGSGYCASAGRSSRAASYTC
jgi:hypothetical protein